MSPTLERASQKQKTTTGLGGEMGALLESLKIKAEFRDVPSDGTALSTAEILKVPPSNVVKSLVFLADGVPVLVVACGNTRIDVAKLGAICLEDGASRCTETNIKKRVHLAPVADAERITGYKIGSIPPFNLRNPGDACLQTNILAAVLMLCSLLTARCSCNGGGG